MPVSRKYIFRLAEKNLPVRGYASGKATLPFLYFSCILNKGQLLKEREQILSFKSRPNFGSCSLYRESNRKPQKLFPFIKSQESMVHAVCVEILYFYHTANQTGFEMATGHVLTRCT